MAQGRVTVNNLNLAQGSFPEVERKALFIGVGTKNVGDVLSINTQSDLDDVLGVVDNDIKTQVIAARANGGEHWQCYAAPQQSAYDWREVVNTAMLTVSPEFIVLCSPALDSSVLVEMQAHAELLRTTWGRRVIILTATPGINTTGENAQTWAQYETSQASITNGVAAYRVCCVPQLHGNDLGALAGRLCNHAVSIADSPMRTATGSVIGLGATPRDSADLPLPSATLTTLDSNRLSCIQTYPDYPGVYWGDANLLDIPAGDYQVIENLRVVDKAARAVRILAIARVANRNFNSSSISKASSKTYFSRPLREMANSVTFAGEQFPGEIKPPKDDAITIEWPTRTSVDVYIKVQPYNAPKTITANIILDLSSQRT